SVRVIEKARQLAFAKDRMLDLLAKAELGFRNLRAGKQAAGDLRRLGTCDTANTLKVPGYTLFDAAVHYDIPNITSLKDNLRLALNATNLANKEYVASCYSYSWCWYGSQRTVQASATYQW
ncbi:TonB-dependent receptor, partial [Klebsiella pneumoniae]